MLLPHPTEVTFDARPLPGVLAVAIDRLAAREVVEFTDAGPHPAFADVPEQRTEVTVLRRLTSPDLHAPRPGDLAELTFIAATGAHDAGRVRFRAACMLRSIRHELGDRAGRQPELARQMLAFIALSPDGAADPITLEPL